MQAQPHSAGVCAAWWKISILIRNECIATGQRQGVPMLPALPSIVGLPANGGAHPAMFANTSSPAPGGTLPPAVPNAGPAVSVSKGKCCLR